MTSPSDPAARWYAVLREQRRSQFGWPMAMAAQAVADATIEKLNTHRRPGTNPLEPTARGGAASLCTPTNSWSRTTQHTQRRPQSAGTVPTRPRRPPHLADPTRTASASPWASGSSSTTPSPPPTHTSPSSSGGWSPKPRTRARSGCPDTHRDLATQLTRHRTPATLISVQPSHGPDLVDGPHPSRTLLGHDATGIPAAINALTRHRPPHQQCPGRTRQPTPRPGTGAPPNPEPRCAA